jgi:hypothetical protein
VEQGYIVARNNKADWGRADKWYLECEKQRCPYARVTPRQTWAAVTLDVAPTGQELGEECKQRIYDAIAVLFAELGYDSWFGYGAYTHVPKVPIERAEALAAELLAIVAEGLMQ